MIPVLDQVCQLLFKIRINQLPVSAARWGNMGHRYISQLLFVKNHKITNNEAGKNLKPYEFWKFFDA
jgi:hypothetical protein